MTQPTTHRRDFLTTTAALGGAIALGSGSSAKPAFAKSRNKMERLRVGAIGLRYQGSVIAHKAQMYGDVVAVCLSLIHI